MQQKNNSFSQDRIDKFIEEVIEVASQEDVHYMDITSVVVDRADLYEPDGMHFTFLRKFTASLLNLLLLMLVVKLIPFH